MKVSSFDSKSSLFCPVYAEIQFKFPFVLFLSLFHYTFLSRLYSLGRGMIVNDKFGRIWREVLTILTWSQYLIVMTEGIPCLRQQEASN
jgi:hypothetical protein